MGKMVPAYNMNVNWLRRYFRAVSERMLGYIQSCHTTAAPKGPNKKWLSLYWSAAWEQGKSKSLFPVFYNLMKQVKK